jgi:hypothetical protein
MTDWDAWFAERFAAHAAFERDVVAAAIAGERERARCELDAAIKNLRSELAPERNAVIDLPNPIMRKVCSAA